MSDNTIIGVKVGFKLYFYGSHGRAIQSLIPWYVKSFSDPCHLGFSIGIDLQELDRVSPCVVKNGYKLAIEDWF